MTLAAADPPAVAAAPTTGRAEGSSHPIGASLGADGVNFSLYAKHATGVELLLFDRPEDDVPARVVAFDRHADRTAGYWHAFWDELLELDPELFAAYTEFSSVPWRSGTLEPKVKELIYIAFDTAATHLYVKGLKLHIENAIGYGATPQEILEVMEIASVLGIHAVTATVPILLEELADGRR